MTYKIISVSLRTKILLYFNIYHVTFSLNIFGMEIKFVMFTQTDFCDHPPFGLVVMRTEDTLYGLFPSLFRQQTLKR